MDEQAPKTTAPGVTIRELAPDELDSIIPMIRVSNPDKPEEELRRRLAKMKTCGYHCAAAFLDGKMVGVSGFWIGTKFYCGEYLEADNVVVLPELRSHGIGSLLMDWVEDYAVRHGIRKIMLDSWLDYTRAHQFYERRGYVARGYHFIKDT